MVPNIGAFIDVGGCVGKITKITDNEVTVRGTYLYSGCNDDKGYAEPWSFVYDKADLEALNDHVELASNRVIWNASKLNHR